MLVNAFGNPGASRECRDGSDVFAVTENIRKDTRLILSIYCSCAGGFDEMFNSTS